jgi:hypothetical protein
LPRLCLPGHGPTRGLWRGNLPLAAKELTRLFPELWSTRKAAEDWARKNPLDPCISIIRVWGVLNTYRPPGQTSRSRALVRHGADPGEALAEVLGVRAGGYSGEGPPRVGEALPAPDPEACPPRRLWRTAGMGRVGMWRGGLRSTMSVAAPFVWRCLSGSAITPFPHPAHRTQQAE